MYHKRKKMKHGGSHDGNAMARREAKMGGGMMREKMGHGGMYGDDMMKRKKKINCAKPKGFSERAYCAGKKKRK